MAMTEGAELDFSEQQFNIRVAKLWAFGSSEWQRVRCDDDGRISVRTVSDEASDAREMSGSGTTRTLELSVAVELIDVQAALSLPGMTIKHTPSGGSVSDVYALAAGNSLAAPIVIPAGTLTLSFLSLVTSTVFALVRNI